MANNQKWRKSSAYRRWAKKVKVRDKKCMVPGCNNTEHLHAHHIEDASNHMKKRFWVKNGITLCRFHHILFHTSYKKSYRYKTNRDDLDNYFELIIKLNEFNKIPNK